jgi:hypothetical protein
VILSLSRVPARAGVEFEFDDGHTLEIFQQYQLQGIYTFSGARTDDGETVDNRADLFLRRARLGLKGQIRDVLSYQVVFAYDNVGKDIYTGASGVPQDQNNTEFRIWDAFFTWRANPQWANVTAGYFRPQIGRESITAAWAVNSFDKALANGYVRTHVVGRLTGRETGINLGGLINKDGWGFNYNIGAFDTTHENIVGSENGGADWSPLLTARAAVTLGDPELVKYGIGYRVNYFGKRNGTTLALNYSHQGRTDLFKNNRMAGFDVLSNYGNLNFSAEYDWLLRNTGDVRFKDRVYHARIGYNIELANGQIIEPALMYTEFNGDRDSVLWSDQRREATNLGVSWYLDRTLELGLFYAWQDDERDRGDYIGLGCQFVW